MRTSFLVALFLAAAFARSEREYKSAFLGWMKQYGRSYEATEFQHRYSIFRDNYDFVQNWNGDFQVALNEFADLHNSEFVKMYTGLNLIVDPASLQNDVEVDFSTTPASVDWRQSGAVTPIKNQGQCGSCWSFSTTGSVEGCHKLATGTLVSFSEQNLVDCSTSEGNEGCNGGLMDDAFQYIIKNKGLDTEASYPYTATGPNACKYNAANSGGTITSYTDVTSGSEAALIAAAALAPISVAIDASHNSFQFYSSGIYYEPQCSSTQLDHGVLVVGYGSTNSTFVKAAPAPPQPTTTSSGGSPPSTSSGSPPSTSSGSPPSTTTSGSPPSTSGTPTSGSPTTSPPSTSGGTPPTTTSGTPPTTSGTPPSPSPTTSGPPAPPSPSNGEYYIVKNSWGTSWGLQGYIWMSRNRNNNCGIATSASYPTGCH